MLAINLADAPRKEVPSGAGEAPKMAKRKALSKRTRFEIFKRDGFRCHYCGATPQSAAMEVSELVLDHVKPVKDGGETAAHNLVTSCVPCNAGKSAVPLGLRKYEPKVGEADREHAEQLREYLSIQRQVADANEDHVAALEEDWDRLTGLRRPARLRSHLRSLSREHTLDQLRYAMEAVGDGRISGSPLAYMHGVLKKGQKRADAPVAPAGGRERHMEEALIFVSQSVFYLGFKREDPIGLAELSRLEKMLGEIVGWVLADEPFPDGWEESLRAKYGLGGPL